jgi:hypothetical protein
MTTFRLSTALAAVAVLVAPVAFAATITGSGRSVTETRNVGEFTSITVAIPARVEVVQSATHAVQIVADDNVMPEIVAEVEAGALKLRFRDRANSMRNTRIRVTVNARTVDALTLSGSGEIHALSLAVPSLAVRISGSGDVKLAGRAQALHVDISGSGNVEAGKLQADRVKVSISGSGDSVVAAKDALHARIAGSGGIRFYGNPEVEKHVSGSGSVRRLGALPG